MKKVSIYLFLALAFTWTLTSCSKSDSEPETDPRDAWVGNYSEIYTGSITINIPGQPMTIPISDSGSFRIEKGTAANKIVRIDSDTTQTTGTINGNQVTFDPVTETAEEQGAIITTTGTASGSLNGNVMNYTMNITGSAAMMGLTIPITGSVTGVATKK